MQMLFWTILISVLIIQRSAARMLVDKCGFNPADPRIMDGKAAEGEAAAWMAAISNKKEFICGGTVIHTRFVLTAAHCIEGQSRLFVSLGAYNKSDPVRRFNVSLALMHNGYNDNTNREHDIGLLKLSTSIQFGLYIYPICINLDPLMRSEVDKLKSFDAYGWGKTRTGLPSEILQKITLNRLDRSQCNQYLRGSMLTSNQLCVGSPYGDTCRGDSGGPLTKKFLVGGKELQIQLAIVSFGKTNCDGEGIYTDVSSYANWIESKVNKYESNKPVLPGNVPYRPPPGFGTNPPPLNAGSQNRRPHRFPTPRRAMFLYDRCGGDDLSMTFLVKIFGDGFEGKGVMITNQYVLTNAKGLPSRADTLEVLAIEEHVFDEMKVKSIFKHPDFSGDFHHDIALLKLKKPVSFSGNRKPICMLLQTRTLLPTAGFLMGIHPVDSSECSDRINRKIERDQLCIEETGMTKKYGNTGDIVGKNLVYRGNNVHILFGIVSYSSNGLTVLTNVMKYTQWIDGIVRNY